MRNFEKIKNLNLIESSECQGYQSLFFFFSFSLFPSPKNPLLFFWIFQIFREFFFEFFTKFFSYLKIWKSKSIKQLKLIWSRYTNLVDTGEPCGSHQRGQHWLIGLSTQISVRVSIKHADPKVSKQHSFNKHINRLLF